MTRYICIHGHFYQPPRENPWLEEVEMQDSARPYHDWNERIAMECYGPNASARIMDSDGYIVDLVNNYAKISFNFGPTLLSWMQRRQPDVYQRILQADKMSRKRFSGHGSAMAQLYNHMIAPLASKRDKLTQALWGLKDFQTRFGRDPEGAWLPETAVDVETLEVLAELGVKFTILAPRQCRRVRRIGDTDWIDVSGARVDPAAPYLLRLPSNRTITLFFFDGPISQDLAFGDLLHRGENLYNRLKSAFTDNGRDWPQLVHTATDGETFGHHHAAGEMALAWCLHLIEKDDSVQLTNYGEYLAKQPPVFEAGIFNNSSWSCVHGVERWKSDCGCNSGGRPEWRQTWRAPLRKAMDYLNDACSEIFENLGGAYFKAPWAARDAYISVILDRSDKNTDRFLTQFAAGPLNADDGTRALKLLEMARFSQLIYTSCGWFFDDISGIETVQILQYAVRAIQLAEELSGKYIEKPFIELLAEAPSNVRGNGAWVYEHYAKPAQTDMLRAGAHYAISALFEERPEHYNFGAFEAVCETMKARSAGRSHLITGRTRIAFSTTREQAQLQFAALHAGDHNVTCGVGFFHDMESFRSMDDALDTAFERGDITETIRALDAYFGKQTYSVQRLFRDEQRKVVKELLGPAFRAAEASYRQIYEANYPLLNFLDWLSMPLPEHFLQAARFTVNTDLVRLFQQQDVIPEQLERLTREADRWGLPIDRETIGYLAAEWTSGRMEQLAARPSDLDLLRSINATLVCFNRPPLELRLWKSQNIYVELGRKILNKLTAQAEKARPGAVERLEAFRNLGTLLRVRPSALEDGVGKGKLNRLADLGNIKLA
jgi:alpha-amylase/alpha-mannosidase (GH57 family)